MPVLENLFSSLALFSSLLSPPPPPPFLSALPTSALFFGLTTCIQEQDTKSAAHVPNLTYRAVLKQIMLKKKKSCCQHDCEILGKIQLRDVF